MAKLYKLSIIEYDSSKKGKRSEVAFIQYQKINKYKLTFDQYN